MVSFWISDFRFTIGGRGWGEKTHHEGHDPAKNTGHEDHKGFWVKDGGLDRQKGYSTLKYE